jgi:hypothetical protein
MARDKYFESAEFTIEIDGEPVTARYESTCVKGMSLCIGTADHPKRRK